MWATEPYTCVHVRNAYGAGTWNHNHVGVWHTGGLYSVSVCKDVLVCKDEFVIAHTMMSWPVLSVAGCAASVLNGNFTIRAEWGFLDPRRVHLKFQHKVRRRLFLGSDPQIFQQLGRLSEKNPKGNTEGNDQQRMKQLYQNPITELFLGCFFLCRLFCFVLYTLGSHHFSLNKKTKTNNVLSK